MKKEGIYDSLGFVKNFILLEGREGIDTDSKYLEQNVIPIDGFPLDIPQSGLELIRYGRAY